MQWTGFDDGRTIGQVGTASGVIIQDCVHPLGARITLEKGGRSAPYTITCGIYGCMVHTRFFSAESQAHQEFDRMSGALDSILSGPANDDDLDDAGVRFIERFP